MTRTIPKHFEWKILMTDFSWLIPTNPCTSLQLRWQSCQKIEPYLDDWVLSPIIQSSAPQEYKHLIVTNTKKGWLYFATETRVFVTVARVNLSQIFLSSPGVNSIIYFTCEKSTEKLDSPNITLLSVC
jgi:hypothetical protein